MNYLKQIYSLLVGRKVGETGYAKANPCIVVDSSKCPLIWLPRSEWTDTEWSACTYRMERYVWSGFSWKFEGVIRFKLNKSLTPKQVMDTAPLETH